MNIKIIISFLTCMMMLFSCQKDVDVFTPNGSPIGVDTNWVASISSTSPIIDLKTALNKAVQFDSLDCTLGGSVTTQEGLTIAIAPNSLLLSNGTPVIGKVYSESLLIRQKGDMIRTDRPTTSNGRLLISGGEIFLRFRKDLEELHLAPGKRVYVKYADPSPITFMRLFLGDESNPLQFNWLPYPDSSNFGFGTPNAPSYEFSSPNLRWLNCDHFADSTGSRVNIVASLPIDYTNANTAVYLVFHDIRSMMSMYGDPATKKFSSAKVPTGKQVTVVSITKKGNNSYYLGHNSTVTNLTGTVAAQVVPLSPQPTSLTDIRAYLSTL